MKKNRLSIKTIKLLILSVVLLCMPAMAFSMNGTWVMDVRAEDHPDTEESAEAESGSEESNTELTEDSMEESTEGFTEGGIETGNEIPDKKPDFTIGCFDTTKPTINAAVSDGLLTVQVHDADSSTKAVYVNGYEFTDLTDGTLNVRLQQFDAGYEYFTISAMDNAGNMSESYKTKNPYYKDPADGSGDDPARQLPVSAEASKPGNATAAVTGHTKTDSEGNNVHENSPAEQKKQAFAEADAAEAAEKSSGDDQENNQSERGKEFYTIQTASNKVFYLIIDRGGEEERVYFLTEITENDLLNVTSDNSETLPKNSAAMESAIPVTEGALPNNNAGQATEPGENAESMESTEEIQEDAESAGETAGSDKENPEAPYLLMGGLATVFIGGVYYLKVVCRKKEDFLDEDDDEDNEEYESEDEGTEDDMSDNDTEDDFFADDSGKDAAEPDEE